MLAATLGSQGTVAITGGTGFIGSKLVSQLLTLGYRVKVLTRNVGSARSKLPYAGVEYVGPAQWAAAVRGCTAVVNLAGAAVGRGGSVWSGAGPAHVNDGAGAEAGDCAKQVVAWPGV